MMQVAKVSSSVPRGFTRFYVLHLISQKPMTGKEMIVEAEKQSDGEWIPSPGLIYPLLGRLLKDNLIEENDDGKFIITTEGIETLSQHSKLQEQLEKQLSLVHKLGLSAYSTGKILAEDSMDRIMGLIGIIQERISDGSIELQDKFNERYHLFLLNELEKMDKEDNTTRTKQEDESETSI